MLGAAEALLENKEVNLYVSCPTSLVDDLCCIEGEKIKYYLFPIGKGNTQKNPEYRTFWRQISETLKPDVVHIHGTEYSHGLEYVEACGADNVVVSIQGLTSVYARYFNDGLSNWDIIRNITLRDMIRGSLFSNRRSFTKRGKYEVELLKRVKYIIGRTNWDKAHAWAINPNAQYYFCNETLRSDFYSGKWEYSKCKPHSLFLSSVAYPIKGVHQLIKALPMIRCCYPDVQVRIAGGSHIYPKNIMDYIRETNYNKYLRRTIRKLRLVEHITFLGTLDANDMKRELLSANIFVCPSSIENSPNSLGEAQLLGVPCISSYVGGIPDMMRGAEESLYRFEEVEMLSNKICEFFTLKGTINTAPMQKVAMQRHNSSINARDLLCIYRAIIKL